MPEVHGWLVGLQEAANGRVAAAEAVLAHQGLVDGGAGDAGSRPGEDALAMGLDLGAWPGVGLALAQDLGQRRVIGQGALGLEPSVFAGDAPELGGFAAPHQSRCGDLAV
ncbi:MAG: hypothetical protein C1943_18630 [Halochromatium sp.]|nr:hypothetical protein [Halochromatium sp.]